MSTNGDNITEDAEMSECDGDKVVTMMDVLQEQQEFEEDANAVLGASDDKNCTYPKGYIKRQAIYACLTCCTEAKEDPTKRAGVCLACSLTCHENHDLVELYTKRNFKCDCGNPKFNSHPCQFTPTKTDLNEDNTYNQNYSGLYCVCHRPYPDPDATFEDDMIQCIICEDWLHSSHLEATVPSNDQYAEMICKGCMEKNVFLYDYTSIAVNVETCDVDVVTVNGNDTDCSKKLTDSEVADVTNNEETMNTDDIMVRDEVDKSAEPSGDVEYKSVEVSSEAGYDKVNDIDMTEEIDKNEQQSEKNVDDKGTVDNNETIIDNKEQKSVLNTELSITHEDENKEQKNVLNTELSISLEDETSKIENVADDPNVSLDSTNHTEQTVEKITPDAEECVEDKKDDSPIGDKTQKPNDNSESTDIKTIEDTNSNIAEAENEQSTEKPENDQDLKTKEEPDKEKVTLEQSTEQTLEETNTSTEQKIRKPENYTDDTETSKETAEKSEDQKLFDDSTVDQREPIINEENTEDQQLLDDLNELTSDEKDSDKANVHQGPNEEDKSEASIAQTTKDTEDDTEDSLKSSKEHTISENVEDSELNEPMDIPNNLENSEANDSNKTEVTQSKEIADDISQNVPTENENNDRTDAVMSAIDEILEGSSAAGSDTEKETVSTTEELKAKVDNVKVDSIVTDKQDDVDISEENNKLSDVHDQTESEDKKITEDIEMTDQNEQFDNKVEEEAAQSANKDSDKEMDGTSKPNETDKKVENNTDVDESKQSQATTDREIKETLDENSIQQTTTSIEGDKSNEKDHAIIEESTDSENKVTVLTEITNENKRKFDTESEEITAKKAKLDEEKICVRPKDVKRVHKGATFWPSSLRQKLCTCGECISMYKDLNVLFLTDLDDTVIAYESLGKENIGISQYEKGLEALSSLGRIQQINALTEYNKMRDKLLDFLKSFKDRKEVVKEEDIKAFFAGMKPRREPDGVYFCR